MLDSTLSLDYFCGVINNAACLYWCRSRPEDLNRLRFYYAMGLSAIVGETVMGTLGASCCKSMSVAADSSRMKELRGGIFCDISEYFQITQKMSVSDILSQKVPPPPRKRRRNFYS